MKQVSNKQRVELALRAKLSLELMNEQKGLCSDCHGVGGWRGLHLAHEILSSQGGKTTRENCSMKCAQCHSVKDHNIREVQSQPQWSKREE